MRDGDPKGAGRLNRRLIVCADDFAQSAAVSNAILALARQGRLTATSAMVLSPRWPQDAEALRPLGARVDVGLHLDWTSAFAHACGHGSSLGRVMWRSATAGWHAQRLQDAIEHQLDAFERHWHQAPDHVDGHQHVHQMNGIRQALLTVLQRRYPVERPWLRVSHTPTALTSAKAKVVDTWGGRALARALTSTGWPHAPCLVGMYGFSPVPQAYGQAMPHWLAHAPDTSVLMCHPALAPDPSDPIGAARLHEHAYLASNRFAHDLSTAKVDLARGRALFHP